MVAQDIILTIGGEPMPIPSVLSWSISTFDMDSGRGTDGTMNRCVIAHKETINLEWRSADLSPQEISKLLRAVMPTFFTVGYYSPLSASWVEKTMYVGDRSTNFYSVIDGKVVQDSITFTLIER